MKSILISIQPKWCELIASGKKTVEVRKTRPQLETPFKCYIYCTNEKHKGEVLLIGNDGKQVAFGDYRNAFHWKNIGNGKVVGEFVCDKFENRYFYMDTDGTPISNICKDFEQASCLKRKEIIDYILRPNKKRNAERGTSWVYGWHISDLKIYDTPKELGEFNAVCPYKKLDGTRKSVDCPCDKYTWDFDEEKGKLYCTRRITRPPQSWCYVEEI